MLGAVPAVEGGSLRQVGARCREDWFDVVPVREGSPGADIGVFDLTRTRVARASTPFKLQHGSWQDSLL